MKYTISEMKHMITGTRYATIEMKDTIAKMKYVALISLGIRTRMPRFLSESEF